MVPEHSHHNEQISMLEQGTLRFVLAGEELILKAGEVLRIPPHVPHSAEALEDSDRGGSVFADSRGLDPRR